MVPAVYRLVNSALWIRPPQTSQCSYVHHIRILRMNHDAPDVPRGLQPHLLPGLSAVERLVCSIAPGGALPVVRLAGTDPNHGRGRTPDGDAPTGQYTLFINYRFP